MDEVAARRAASFLMWGSVALLPIAPFAWLTFYFCAPLWLGLGLHLAGWHLLWRAIWRDDPRVDRGTRALLRGGFLGSILGFVVGLVTLPAAVPSVGWFDPVWGWILITGFFAFVPTVYGPVVAGHAVVFLAGTRVLGNRRATRRIAAGSATLLALVGIGIFLQIRGGAQALVFSLLPFMAGLTSVGYAAIALGWRIAARDRRRVALAHGASGSRPGQSVLDPLQAPDR